MNKLTNQEVMQKEIDKFQVKLIEVRKKRDTVIQEKKELREKLELEQHAHKEDQITLEDLAEKNERCKLIIKKIESSWSEAEVRLTRIQTKYINTLTLLVKYGFHKPSCKNQLKGPNGKMIGCHCGYIQEMLNLKPENPPIKAIGKEIVSGPADPHNDNIEKTGKENDGTGS